MFSLCTFFLGGVCLAFPWSKSQFDVCSGFPATEQNLLRLRFKLNSGSKKLDTKKVTALTLSLVDALGASIKLPHDVSSHVVAAVLPCI